MPPPGAVQDGLAAVAAAVAVVHAVRLTRRPPVPDLEVAHLACAGSMALMLLGLLGPGPVLVALGAISAVTGWLLVRAVHSFVLDGAGMSAAAGARRYAVETIAVLPMVWMLAAVAAGGRHGAGMAMGAVLAHRTAGTLDPAGVLDSDLVRAVAVAAGTLACALAVAALARRRVPVADGCCRLASAGVGIVALALMV